MANYDEKYGLVFEGQSNQNWGLTLHIPEKVPLTTNSIFDTYEHMLAYVNNPTSSAIKGLTLSVVGDTDTTKNGVYYVTAIGTKGEDGNALNNGAVVKLSTNTDSTATADEVKALLDAEVKAREDADKFISGATSANTENIATLRTDLNTVSGKADANATAITANAEAITATTAYLNAHVESAATVVEGIVDEIEEVSTALTEFTTAQETKNTELSNAISANTDAISANTQAIAGLGFKNVKSGDKILSIDSNSALTSTFGVEYKKEDNKIYFTGVGGAELGTVDTTDFIKDGMLSGVTLDKQEGKPTYMVFAFNTDGGTETIKLDVEEFLNADEVATLENSLAQHKLDTTLHFTTQEKAKLGNLPDNATLEARLTNIEGGITANTKSVSDLATEFSGYKDSNDKKIAALEGSDVLINARINAVDEWWEGTVDPHIASATTAITANTENIAKLRTDLDVVSGKADANATAITANATAITANAEAITALTEVVNGHITETSNALNEIAEDISEINSGLTTVNEKITTVETEYKAADQVLTQSITSLGEKVTENEEVVAAALTDLKENKVSSIVAEEGSNIVVTETKSDSGISYSIGFQWLEF
jgi:chromosome segregation ATPase